MDSNNLAVDGVFSGDQSTLTYNSTTYNLVNNANGPDYYADRANNKAYYQGVEIPALKVEQYEASTYIRIKSKPALSRVFLYLISDQ